MIMVCNGLLCGQPCVYKILEVLLEGWKFCKWQKAIMCLLIVATDKVKVVENI
jgi:hypothetical protein